jgi:hypothetical protein
MFPILISNKNIILDLQNLSPIPKFNVLSNGAKIFSKFLQEM